MEMPKADYSRNCEAVDRRCKRIGFAECKKYPVVTKREKPLEFPVRYNFANACFCFVPNTTLV